MGFPMLDILCVILPIHSVAAHETGYYQSGYLQTIRRKTEGVPIYGYSITRIF